MLCVPLSASDCKPFLITQGLSPCLAEAMDPESTFILDVRKADSPFYNRPAHTVVWSDSFLALLATMGVAPDVEVRGNAGKPVQGVAIVWRDGQSGVGSSMTMRKPTL